jgi:hypothetical protein
VLVTKFYSGDKIEENKILGGGDLNFLSLVFNDTGFLPEVTVTTFAVTP